MATADRMNPGTAALRGGSSGDAGDRTAWVPFSVTVIDALSAVEREVWPASLLPSRGVAEAGVGADGDGAAECADRTVAPAEAGGPPGTTSADAEHRRRAGAALARGIAAHRSASAALLSWWVCGPEATAIAEVSVSADSALVLVGSSAVTAAQSDGGAAMPVSAPELRAVLLVRLIPLTEVPATLASLVPADARGHATVLTVSPRTPARARVLAEPSRDEARGCVRAEIMRLAAAGDARSRAKRAHAARADDGAGDG